MPRSELIKLKSGHKRCYQVSVKHIDGMKKFEAICDYCEINYCRREKNNTRNLNLSFCDICASQIPEDIVIERLRTAPADLL